MKVYVAASSDELPRAKLWMARLREAGITVTSTWPTTIESVGSANRAGVEPEQRRVWARSDLVDLDEADWFWLLVPTMSPGRGAYVELGVAWAERKHIISSGNTTQSIFCSLGMERATDVEALAELVRAARASPHG